MRVLHARCSDSFIFVFVPARVELFFNVISHYFRVIAEDEIVCGGLPIIFAVQR